MEFLFAGTAIVWLSILGYVISLSVRQKKLSAQIDRMERSEGM